MYVSELIIGEFSVLDRDRQLVFYCDINCIECETEKARAREMERHTYRQRERGERDGETIICKKKKHTCQQKTLQTETRSAERGGSHERLLG